jgi:hypothetical protein
MHTLDLLSQVLFVGLMAMLLYVLYNRFVQMLSKDRIQGAYANIVTCVRQADGQLSVEVECSEPTECKVAWKGGEATLSCGAGLHSETIASGPAQGEDIVFTFDNQVVRRKVS